MSFLIKFTPPHFAAQIKNNLYIRKVNRRFTMKFHETLLPQLFEIFMFNKLFLS